ncbi:hypothetical protein [Loktanella sp. SALINAS62]|uniref:hypothetical protein n=1 Tax=Loktanella sp. SALINAS62 TaxID=2706124 RepID=UPI001B8DA02C|nr:hypothetical protein [Loktanella sp. SALINAS62]MBS1303306.1 hypothetical protein [Loktanella sp. SALINAS62]
MAEEKETDVLEEGDIFFFYRPKINLDDPDALDDIQRFYFAMRPKGGKDIRLCIAGRKHLPDVKSHERVWGFVDMVTKEDREIERGLREERYQTKTRDEQREPAARPVGEGVYAITLEDGQMHLSYALELPEDPGQVQRTFNIAQEASFALSVKNPEKGQPKGAGLSEDQEADYPNRLQDVFRDRRFAREDVRLLNYEGAEFILVGARQDPKKAYGAPISPKDEDYGSSDTVRKLRMVKSRHPVKPLFEGEWDRPAITVSGTSDARDLIKLPFAFSGARDLCRKLPAPGYHLALRQKPMTHLEQLL